MPAATCRALQVLRGNIRVMCRVRPTLPSTKSAVSYPLEGMLAISDGTFRQREFEFDAVFGPEASQVLPGTHCTLTSQQLPCPPQPDCTAAAASTAAAQTLIAWWTPAWRMPRLL